MCQPVDAIQPLLQPLTTLRGVGPAVADKLARAAGGPRVLDLLFHLPESYIDRRSRPKLSDALPGAIATFEVEVMTVRAPDPGTRQPWKVVVTDGSGFAELAFWERQLPAQAARGRHVIVSGKVEQFGDRIQIATPRIVTPERGSDLPGIEPVWGLTAGLFPSQVRAALRQAIALVPALPEWHGEALMRREGWPGFRDALLAVHLPTEPPGDLPRARLAYDELLAHQVAMVWARNRGRARPGRAVRGDGRHRAEALRRFGHAPTPSQHRALAEIDADLHAPRRMLRLLQGDVGSGKTLVALLAMLNAAEAGGQAALMAPTEVLAFQHHRVLSRLSPVPVGLLTGSVKGVERRRVLGGLANGRLPLVVGTHALFQEAVEYHALVLAVIDEQHRFGVEQRLTLSKKGGRADVLVMTATPIPRSLLLLQYNEMEVSRLTEKPAGRQPIRTTIHSVAKMDRVLKGIGRQLDRGRRVYWVCPDGERERAARTSPPPRPGIAALRERFRTRTSGLAHGQQERLVARPRPRRVRLRRGAPAGRHHRDRGRRGRARGQHHGDRTRRALRPGPTAPAPRPRRPGCRPELLPAAARNDGLTTTPCASA